MTNAMTNWGFWSTNWGPVLPPTPPLPSPKPWYKRWWEWLKRQLS
jgi:hypothetical protein